MIKKLLMIIAVLVVLGLAVLQFSLSLAPYKTADFFLQHNTDRFLLWTKDGRFSVDIRKMAEGVTNEDRLFLQRKRAALETLVLGEDTYETELNDYHIALVEAGKDGLLTLEELKILKNLHSDLLPEELVNNWVDLAKKYRDVIRDRGRREKYSYIKQ